MRLRKKPEHVTAPAARVVAWARIRAAVLVYAVVTIAAATLELTGMAPEWLLSPPVLMIYFGAVPALGVSVLFGVHRRLAAGSSSPVTALNRYQRLLESPRSCLIVHDGVSIVEVSRGTVELLGAPRSEIIDSPIESIIDPPSILWTAAEPSATGVLEAELIAPDGRHVPVAVSISRVHDADDTEWILVLNDLTRRKIVEDALEHNLMFHSTLLDTIPNPLFFKNAEGLYVDCNTAFSEFFGKAKEDIVGRSVYDLMPQPQAGELAATDARVMADDAGIHYEASVIDRTGETRQVLVNLAPFHSPAGETIGLVGIQTDITARKRMEEELHAAKEAAEEANRTKSRFLAHMTHEFRTPMNAILGYARLLSDTCAVDESRSKIELIVQHGEHLLDLVNDLLDLSRLEAGRAQPRYQAFSLSELVDEVTEAFAVEASSKGLRLSASMEVANGETVIGDRARVRQILYNLASNAVKFCDEGGVTISVERPVPDEIVRFEVRDTGPGIPRERRDSIFSPFERAEHRVSNAPGTGLGLAICRELATLMGGTVVLLETSEEGSTFVADIPLPPSVHRGTTSLEVSEQARRTRTVVQGAGSSAAIVPSREALDELRSFARKGDIASITERARAGVSGEFAEFYRSVAQHAERFEIQKLRELLENATTKKG